MSRRIRASGTLTQSSRGWLLTTADDAVWVLQSETAIVQPIESIVTVEGEAIGYDRLRLEWIGPASASQP